MAAGICALLAAVGVTGTASAHLSDSSPRSPHGSTHAPKAVPVPVPTVAGPVVTTPNPDTTRGFPYTSSAVDLASNGYSESEYFVSGSARAYQPDGDLTTDGQWKVHVASTASYKTRILVRKPVDMSTFSGTVVVEWMNATVGRDLDVGWVIGNNGLMHDHDVYVGVTAQALPVDGAAQGLKSWDPDRYGSLVHPGDEYSYDIFAQVAQALRHPSGVDPISGTSVKSGHGEAEHKDDSNARIRSVIAYGDSQSAFRLTTYADALQNRDQVFDGILIHSRFGNAAALNTDVTPPVGTRIRTDLAAKVLTLESESDIVRAGGRGYAAARQADSNIFRLWEVAGSAHFNAPQEASMRIQAFRENPFADPPLQFNTCDAPMNTLRFSDILDTAYHSLARWTTVKGYRPPTATRLAVTPDLTAYDRDSLGFTKGGIRLPQVTVPIGVNTGVLTNTGTSICSLVGDYTPFSQSQLESMYPTHQSYVDKYSAAVRAAEKAGFIQRYDALLSISEAANSVVPAITYVP